MDKTHNISLGGFAFFIEDAAYQVLVRYLNEIQHSVGNTTGAQEIIADVEYRMAELLRERLMAREVVNMQDINYLVSVMGEPKEFYSEDITDNEPHASYQQSSTYYKTNKKFYRDPDNKVLGGVLSGLGYYLGVDATWMRIIFIVGLFVDPLFFSMATTLVVGYLILWLVVPIAKTTSEKLQMRGEPVNIDSIKDFFGKSPEIVKNNLQDVGDNARRVASQSGSLIGNLLQIILKAFGILFLIIFLIIAIALIISFIAVILGIGGAFLGVGTATFSLSDYAPYIFENTWETYLTYISLFLVMVIPAIALILLVLRIISKRYSVPRYVGFGLPLLWLVGIIGTTALIGLTFKNFSTSQTDTKTINLPTTAKTLIIQRDESEYDFNAEELLNLRPGYLAFPNANHITVKKSNTGNNYLELKYTSKGANKEAAQKSLDNIEFNYKIQDSLVRLDKYSFIKKGNKWRNQQIKPILYLTDSTQVVFNNFDDGETIINGNSNWFDADSENIYKIIENDFKCVNCTEEVVEIYNQNTKVDGENVDIQISPESISVKNKKDTINIKINSK